MADSKGHTLFRKEDAAKGRFAFTTEDYEMFDVCFYSIVTGKLWSAMLHPHCCGLCSTHCCGGDIWPRILGKCVRVSLVQVTVGARTERFTLH